MSVQGITAAGQRAARQRLMTDACRVERVGEVVTSDDGTNTPTVQLIYEGPCRVKPLVSRAEGGGSPGPAPTGLFEYTLSLPMAVTGVEYGDRVTVTASSADPSLPGRVLAVGTAERGSQITARRMRCTEVSR